MKEIEYSDLEFISGGDFIEGFCLGLAAGSTVYGIGVWTNWWNPVGWVSAAALVTSGACIAYGIYQLN